MRIGIDYTPGVRQRHGIGRYTRSLIGALAQSDRRNQYILLYPNADRPEGKLFPGRRNFHERPVPFTERALAVIWHRLRLPAPVEWFTGRLDIFHSLDFTLPPLRRAAGLVTVHDLSFLILPECADAGLSAYLQRVVPTSVHRATLVVADSQHTKNDLIVLLDLPPERVEVLYCGVEPRFRRVTDPAELDAVRERYELDGPFILSVGLIEPRKNHARLLRAYHALREQGRVTHRLVIAGGRGWLCDEVYQTAAALALGDAVRFLGYVPDEDLPALYSLADVFAFPSLYEGFGLPPLEAMACGTPVVTSNSSSLPEVVGDAALTVDPHDIEAITAALDLAIHDTALRQRLTSAGVTRAAEFDWTVSAERLVGIYRRAAELARG